jgi:glyoxylase-like metal-dependent hydrolase (beta-lactamase superfamily II)
VFDVQSRQETKVKNKRTSGVLPLATALVSLGALVSASAQQPATRSIAELRDGLYRAQNNQHFTVFLVTPEGVILSDPINTEFAQWLKGELEQRFDVPVRYVLYSHHHWDHASGGAVFAETADFVGHEMMAEMLRLPPASTPLPANAASADANRNGRIEQTEATGAFQQQFALYDANGDGTLTGAEVVRGPVSEVYPAQTLFADTKTVTLGGESVEMIHIGPTHSEDMTVLRFPNQRAVFLVDFISLKRLPFRNLPGFDIDDLAATIAGVEAMDFDMAIGGHGDVGTKVDVAEHRQYLQELHAAVADGISQGRTLEQLQQSVTMDAYSDWANYQEWRTENIAGMYAILTAGD